MTMSNTVNLVVGCLILFPASFNCLRCYSSFCLDGSPFCHQQCYSNETACTASFYVHPIRYTVDLLLFQCSHVSTQNCDNPVCEPDMHHSGIHSCCCNTDLCNFVPTTEFTAPPVVETPQGTVPPSVNGQLVCEVYNCSAAGNTECFHGYENCHLSPSLQASGSSYQYCYTTLSFESDSYVLQEKGCQTTTDVSICHDSCHIDTSGTSSTSCCCTNQLCNQGTRITYSDISRVRFLDDPCEHISCSHGCIIVHEEPQCLCPKGFALDGSNHTCIDINECNEPNHCEVCVNSIGSFSCACSGNRLLNDDGYTCRDPVGLLCARHNCNQSECQTSAHHCNEEYPNDDDSKIHECLSTYYLRPDGTFELRLGSCFSRQASTSNCPSRDKCVLKAHPAVTGAYTCCCTSDFCNSRINVVFPNVTNGTRVTTIPKMISKEPSTDVDFSSPTDPTSGTGVGTPLSTTFQVFIAVMIIFFVVVLAIPIVLGIVCVFCRHRNKTLLSEVDEENSLPDDSESGGTELKELIGQGQFASVWHAQYRNGDAAVKIFSKKDYESYKTERNIYTTPLTHPNILKFISYHEAANQSHLYFEFHRRGSLYILLKHNTVELSEFCELAESLAAGLAYLHQETTSTPPKPAIAHRDLKSKNVLVKNNGQCCISDFGLAVKFQSGTEHLQLSHGQVGTSRYMAPEVLEGAINFGRDPYLRIDDYALGLIIWEIASRTVIPNATVKEYKAPFEEETPPNPTIEEMRAVVVTRQQRPTMPSGFQNNAVFDPITDTICEAWDADAESRLSAQCVYERIRSFRIEHFGTSSQISKDSGIPHEQDTSQSTPPPPATPSFSSIVSDQKPPASTSYEPHTTEVHTKSNQFFSKMRYNYSTHSTETTV